VSNKDTIIEALTMQLKIEREGNLALVKRAKREWVGLTDEEVGGLTVFDGLHDVEVPILADFVRAVEAKLKEKNG